MVEGENEDDCNYFEFGEDASVVLDWDNFQLRPERVTGVTKPFRPTRNAFKLIIISLQPLPSTWIQSGHHSQLALSLSKQVRRYQLTMNEALSNVSR